jgi:hypothetical protein
MANWTGQPLLHFRQPKQAEIFTPLSAWAFFRKFPPGGKRHIDAAVSRTASVVYEPLLVTVFYFL